MTATSYLDTPQGRKLAFHRVEGRGPCVVFLGGLKSDMMGTKAVFLEEWAVRTGHAFLRFDYSGHGESSGLFTDGCIGDWAEDTRAAVTALTDGPIIPVGSSMGGWQALLLSRAMPDAIAGLVTIAAAPDFTEDGYWASFTDAQKRTLVDEGQVELPSDYMEPYVITRRCCATRFPCRFPRGFFKEQPILRSALPPLCVCLNMHKDRTCSCSSSRMLIIGFLMTGVCRCCRMR